MFNIKKIKGHNFRSLKGDTSFSFDDCNFGLYQIAGDIGQGKSTFFIDLPYWILFGKTTRGLKANNIHSWHTKGYTSGSLEFTIDNDSHLIERQWNPNKLLLDGIIVEQNDINKLIKFDEDSIQHTIFIAQFTEMFFDKTPGPRLDLISNVLDLDYWLKCSKKASASLINKKKTLEKKIRDRSFKDGQLTQLISQGEDYDNQIDLFEANKIEDICEKNEEIRNIEDQCSNIEDELRSSDENILEYEKNLGEVQKELKKLDSKFEDLESNCYILERNSEELKLKRIPLENDVDKFNNLDNICPECEQEVNEDHLTVKLNALQKEIDNILKKESKIDKKITKLKGFMNDAVKVIEELERKDADISRRILSATQSRGIAQASLNIYDKDIVKIENQIEVLKNKENPYDRLLNETIDKMEDLNNVIKKLKDEEKTLNKEIVAIEYWVKGYKEIRLFIVEEVLNNLEIQTNNYINDLGLDGWSIKFDVEKENKHGGVSKGFHIMIESPDSEGLVPWESWSGGESQLLRLAGTLGLSDMIINFSGSNCNILVLDEPTKHMGNHEIKYLLDLLYAKAENDNKIIFFIDHHSYDFGSFSDIINIVKGENGASKIESRSISI